MEHTKKWLALLLTVALALSLALPVMAVDWDEFRITKHPKSLTIIHGESFTLSVEVSLPASVVDVAYQWYWRSGSGSINIQGATEPTLQRGPGDPLYPIAIEAYREYFCEITAYEKDDDDNGHLSKKLTSGSARVTVNKKEPTFWENLLGFFFTPIAGFAMFFMMFVMPFLAAPYLWIKGLFN